MAYQIDGDDRQYRMQVKFSSLGQTGDLGVRSKGLISLNYGLHVNFKDFYTKLLCVIQMKDAKHIRLDFHSVTLIMPQGSDFGALGVPRGVKKIIFFKHGHVAYQINGDDEQNKMQVKFLS